MWRLGGGTEVSKGNGIGYGYGKLKVASECIPGFLQLFATMHTGHVSATKTGAIPSGDFTFLDVEINLIWLAQCFEVFCLFAIGCFRRQIEGLYTYLQLSH